jgi:hypothetical protein
MHQLRQRQQHQRQVPQVLYHPPLPHLPMAFTGQPI